MYQFQWPDRPHSATIHVLPDGFEELTCGTGRDSHLRTSAPMSDLSTTTTRAPKTPRVRLHSPCFWFSRAPTPSVHRCWSFPHPPPVLTNRENAQIRSACSCCYRGSRQNAYMRIVTRRERVRRETSRFSLGAHVFVSARLAHLLFHHFRLCRVFGPEKAKLGSVYT